MRKVGEFVGELPNAGDDGAGETPKLGAERGGGGFRIAGVGTKGVVFDVPLAVALEGDLAILADGVTGPVGGVRAAGWETSGPRFRDAIA